MSSGNFHALASIAGGIVGGGALYYATKDIPASVALGGACILGVIVSPDLDVTHPTHSHSEVRRRFGIIPALLWWLLWMPYGWMVPKHRSMVSHFPILSTAGRAGYLGTLILPVLWAIRQMSGLTFDLPGRTTWFICMGMFLALVLVSILHFDLPQAVQRAAFWVMMGVLLAAVVIWSLAAASLGIPSIMALPAAAWMFLGLSLSDTLHALCDWYLPGGIF